MGDCVAAPRFSLSLVWVLEDLFSKREKRVTQTVCLGSLPPGSMVLLCWSSVFGKYWKEIGSDVWAMVIAVVVFLYLLGSHSSISSGCFRFFWATLWWLLRWSRKGMAASSFQLADVLLFMCFLLLVFDVLLRWILVCWGFLGRGLLVFSSSASFSCSAS